MLALMCFMSGDIDPFPTFMEKRKGKTLETDSKKHRKIQGTLGYSTQILFNLSLGYICINAWQVENILKYAINIPNPLNIIA